MKNLLVCAVALGLFGLGCGDSGSSSAGANGGGGEGGEGAGVTDGGGGNGGNAIGGNGGDGGNGPGPGPGGAGGEGGTGGGVVVECNPVTNDGCDSAAGEACDATADGFVCFPAPNDVALCGECSNSAGPFCEAGSTCVGAEGTQCVKYCCDDGDCGSGVCDTGGGLVGVCVVAAGGTEPACDAPAVAPSNGSCLN